MWVKPKTLTKPTFKMELLDKLTPTLTKAILGNNEFLFMVTPQLVQHQPVRAWTEAQLTERYHQLLGDQLIFQSWRGMLTVTAPDQHLILVLPGQKA